MRVALAQILSGHDVEANLAKVTGVAREAAAANAQLVVFPEATMYAFGAPLADIAEPLDGPFGSSVQRLARDLGVTIVLGLFTPATMDGSSTRSWRPGQRRRQGTTRSTSSTRTDSRSRGPSPPALSGA